MGYSRSITPTEPLTGQRLISALAGLGMAFAVEPLPHANIEDAIIGASVAGMEDDDLRVLGLLVAWLDVHHQRLNVDRITRMVPLQPERTRAFWGSMATRLGTGTGNDRRWARLASTSGGVEGGRIDLVRTGNAFQVRRRGEDHRFSATRMLVPAGVLRERKGDILTPVQLAHLHRGYRHRVLIGPSYRADAWAELVGDPTLTAAALARRTYTSFATAWQVKKDYSTWSG